MSKNSADRIPSFTKFTVEALMSSRFVIHRKLGLR